MDKKGPVLIYINDVRKVVNDVRNVANDHRNADADLRKAMCVKQGFCTLFL